MGLFDKLFGRKRQDAEAPSVDTSLEHLRDRLGPPPAGSGDPRSAAAPPAARPSPPREVVRLRLLVPIPHGGRLRSWLGGNPRLPDPFTWPHGDDEPFRFVGQIDCSELPEGLWQGSGPRRGWLAFFVGTRKGYVAAEVLHAPTLGPERPAPAPWTRSDVQLTYSMDAPDDWRFDPPCWPVEVLVQREGETELWHSVFEKHGTPEEPGRYAREVIDLARPEYQPHDWEALRALLTILRKAANHIREDALRRLGTETDAQNAPPPDREIPATIRSEAVAAAERFAALEAALPWDPELWAPYAKAAARWRTLLLQRELESGAPLPTVAAQLHNYATAIIRAVPISGPYAIKKVGPADPEAYQRLHALQRDYLARSQAMRADPRLPPESIGEKGAMRSNQAGYRAFRAERPELWSEYADALRQSFATLADIEVALRLAKKLDPFGTPVSTYTYSHDWPQSHEAASALLRAWVTTAERAAAAAEVPRPDRSAKVAAARDWLAEVEAVESSLASVTVAVTDAAASGAPWAWEEWRSQVEALLASNVLRGYAKMAPRSWNNLRSALAVRAYTRNPAAPALPAPVLAYFLERWRYESRFEIACMGGVPHGYTEVMDEEDEDRTALLLELPDSKLLGWSWGDVSNLVIAIPMDALRRGDFGKAVAGVTN